MYNSSHRTDDFFFLKVLSFYFILFKFFGRCLCDEFGALAAAIMRNAVTLTGE